MHQRAGGRLRQLLAQVLPVGGVHAGQQVRQVVGEVGQGVADELLVGRAHVGRPLLGEVVGKVHDAVVGEQRGEKKRKIEINHGSAGGFRKSK